MEEKHALGASSPDQPKRAFAPPTSITTAPTSSPQYMVAT
jgi:hypothetical protein